MITNIRTAVLTDGCSVCDGQADSFPSTVKLQFVGERQGSALDPLKPFLKEGFKNPKNFKKIIYQCFLKALGSPETLLKKGFWWGSEAATR